MLRNIRVELVFSDYNTVGWVRPPLFLLNVGMTDNGKISAFYCLDRIIRQFSSGEYTHK